MATRLGLSCSGWAGCHCSLRHSKTLQGKELQVGQAAAAAAAASDLSRARTTTNTTGAQDGQDRHPAFAFSWSWRSRGAPVNPGELLI